MTGEPSARWRCRRCGNCCARPEGYVAFTTEEIGAAAAALDLTTAGFSSLHLERRLADGRYLLKRGAGPGCPFLVPGSPARCRIYAARPEACRTFPDWPELRAEGGSLAEAKRWCPGFTEDDGGVS